MMMNLMTVLVKKVFISSKPSIVCLLCPPPCGPFSIQESAVGGLSYKEIKAPILGAFTPNTWLLASVRQLYRTIIIHGSLRNASLFINSSKLLNFFVPFLPIFYLRFLFFSFLTSSNKIKEFPFLYQKRFRIHEIFSQHLNSLYLHVISLL